MVALWETVPDRVQSVSFDRLASLHHSVGLPKLDDVGVSQFSGSLPSIIFINANEIDAIDDKIVRPNEIGPILLHAAPHRPWDLKAFHSL